MNKRKVINNIQQKKYVINEFDAETGLEDNRVEMQDKENSGEISVYKLDFLQFLTGGIYDTKRSKYVSEFLGKPIRSGGGLIPLQRSFPEGVSMGDIIEDRLHRFGEYKELD